MQALLWIPSRERARAWEASDGRNPYRWVMMTVWFVMMTVNSITLTNYPLALPAIAREFHVSPGTYAYYGGVLSYSLGLFVVYFSDIRSWMTTRVRTAILLAQAAMVIPSFLLPLARSYALVVLLRFVQGLWFIELGLATVQLKGWFRRSQIALALAAPLSALVVGSAVGGLLEKVLVASAGWQTGTYVTAGVTVLATILFLAFYRDAPGYRDYLVLSRADVRAAREGRPCPPSWRLLPAYTIGLAQLATTMTFASIPFLVPAVGLATHYGTARVSNTVFIYGMLAAVGIWAGAVLGDRLTRNTAGAGATFRARNLTRTVSQIVALAGFLLLLAFPSSYAVYTLGSVLAALILFNIPNYWAEMGEVTPPGVAADFIFFSGAIASSGFFLGPLLSIALIVMARNLDAALWAFVVVIIFSEAVNLWQNRIPLPVDIYGAGE